MPAPPQLPVRQSGQRVGDGIDIGRDRQTQMFEIIARVDDDQQILGRHDARQTKGELRAPDAAGQGNDH